MKYARVEEMELAVADFLKELLEHRMKQVLNSYGNNKTSLEAVNILRALAGERTGQAVICFLRSSYVTETHNFYLIFYKEDPFVEENPDAVVYSMKSLFEGIDEDVRAVEGNVKSKFIQVFSGELEELRRGYMEQVYQACEKLFCKIVEDAGNELNLDVYYGEYMGEIKGIGRI